jgi:hypothetical protein
MRLLAGTATDTDSFSTRFQLRLGYRGREREEKDDGFPQHELNGGNEKDRDRGRSKSTAEQLTGTS